ncbi:hypothetical protein HDC90_001098 [Pedobacter sp. AK013]|uniref:hypothetical protein n=1 Tax=Pedobacter sp. AK013 TaxID=2723071 RepID=UPI00160ABF7B|nr:hypothetical protein [Pedobacter sp. AK013]MBB6236486.1 hypothetical protein [Pedobacter sp. AK013]
MATDKKELAKIDNSDPANYPNARIKDDTGTGDGTPVNRLVYSDLHEFFAKLMRLAAIAYNGLPDNESNGYQLVDAAIALAGKNDIITPLGVNSGVLQVPLKFSTLKDGEALICKAGFDLNTETTIKGIDPLTKAIEATSKFKTNDYVRFIYSSSGAIKLVRLADGLNLDTLVAELNYLKGATLSEEYAGTSTVKSTTPYTNQLAFAQRVIGSMSSIFLATALRNGLLSKEDKAIIDGIAQSPIRNTGWFSGLDPGSAQVGSNLPVSGDVLTANVYYANPGGESTVRITLKNPMSNMNYFIRSSVESEGNILADNGICVPVFKKESTTQFSISVEEVYSISQNLKIHIEAVQLS